MLSVSETGTRYRAHLSVVTMALISGDYHAALRNLQEAFQEIEDVCLELDNGGLQNLYHIAGKVYTCNRLYEQAEHAFRQAMKHEALLGDHNCSNTRHLAEVYRLQGKLTHAQALYQQCIDDLKNSCFKTDLAKNIMGLGLVHLDSGNLAEAESCIKSALDIFEENLGDRSFWYGRCLMALARLRFGQGDVADCKKLLSESLNIIEPLIGPHHPLRALALDRLAHCLRQCGDETEANELLSEVRSIHRHLTEHDI